MNDYVWIIVMIPALYLLKLHFDKLEAIHRDIREMLRPNDLDV